MKRNETTVLFLTVCLGLLLTNCKGPKSLLTPAPADCIQHLIALDDPLGRIRNHACETFGIPGRR